MKSFKEKYSEDPEFRDRHLAYLREKVTCECGKVVSRVNKQRHMTTPVHHKRMKTVETSDISALKKEVAQLKEMISKRK